MVVHQWWMGEMYTELGMVALGGSLVSCNCQ